MAHNGCLSPLSIVIAYYVDYRGTISKHDINAPALQNSSDPAHRNPRVVTYDAHTLPQHERHSHSPSRVRCNGARTRRGAGGHGAVGGKSSGDWLRHRRRTVSRARAVSDAAIHGDNGVASRAPNPITPCFAGEVEVDCRNGGWASTRLGNSSYF